MRYVAPRGTYDILPPGPERDAVGISPHWQYIESVFRELVGQWGYNEIRTPIFESTALIHRSAGDSSDVVSKETYDFTTKPNEKGESDALTLRPEGTAGVMRAFIEHALHFERSVWKLFYIGPNFRHEAPQKGRYRQHHQAGVEVLGSKDPSVDAEVIALAVAFYQKLGVTGMNVKVNSLGSPESRAAYLTALREWAKPLLPQMSDDNRRRYEQNALRMLDSKDEGDIRLLATAPRLADHLDTESRANLDALLAHLTALHIPYEVDDKLVRGFDYYTGTVFEIQSSALGDKALGGGGRYDNLIGSLEGPDTPGIGFGLGLERVLLALSEAGVALPKPEGVTAYLVPIGESARKAFVPLLSQLRATGIRADMDYTGRRMKHLFAEAEKVGARYMVIAGDNELAQGVVNVKNLITREENSVALEQLTGTLIT